MFGRLGFAELLLVLLLALVIFGPGKLARLGKALGETVRGFREETGEK